MAGLAHAGLGLASKGMTPKVPVIVLILAAYLIDIAWGIFLLAGIQVYPEAEHSGFNVWSHSFFMALIWSFLGGVIAGLITRNGRTALMIGLLVFSHWVLDFISHPMTAVFPDDTGLPIFFGDSPLIGLGIWRTQWGVNIGEYGTLILGSIIYMVTIRSLRKNR